MLASDHKNTVFSEVRKDERHDAAYTAYGDSASAGSLGYNGERSEAQTGWYLLGNGYRTYNAGLMRFHSPDRLSPFGEGGINAYMYCGGNPIAFQDPTGSAFFGFGWVVKLAQRISKVFSKSVPKAPAPARPVNSPLSLDGAVNSPFRNQGFNNLPEWPTTWGARDSLGSLDSSMFNLKPPSTTGSVRSALKGFDDISDASSVSSGKWASIDGHVYDKIGPTKAPRNKPLNPKQEAKKATERLEQKQLQANANKARRSALNDRVKKARQEEGRFQT